MCVCVFYKIDIVFIVPTIKILNKRINTNELIPYRVI